jgi:hypothetical protein
MKSRFSGIQLEVLRIESIVLLKVFSKSAESHNPDTWGSTTAKAHFGEPFLFVAQK